MRNRTDADTTTITGSWRPYDLLSNSYGGGNAYSTNFVVRESQMWDDPTGGRRLNKACIHLSYVADLITPKPAFVDSGDGSNYPNPRTRYEDVNWYHSTCNGKRPPGTLIGAPGYIPVSADSTDDVGRCVQQAYNRYVTGVTALDASVSIAEAGETPRLFEMWQRRKAAPSNLVSGFLGYSFGWRPLLNDLRAITKELRSFPHTVRKRLKSIGNGDVVRHYKFELNHTVNDLNEVHEYADRGSLPWQKHKVWSQSVYKSRVVCVTIRANVKPKLGPEGQAILDKLGSLGLVPSLATLWAVTRLSFVVDWFYNIGGAIENLQGSLTHDISNVSVCVSDTRERTIFTRAWTANALGGDGTVLGIQKQRYYSRQPTSVSAFPVLTYPRRAMPYVLLGLLGMVQTKGGRLILSKLDGSRVSQAISRKVTAALDRLSPRKRSAVVEAYTKVIPTLQRKLNDLRKKTK